MTRPLRIRWLLERLTFLLLCIGIGAVYEVGKVLWPGDSKPASLSPHATGTCLDRRVDHLHVVEMPLEEVMGVLSRQTGQRIVVDWGDVVGDWGETRQTPISLDLNDVKLDSALQTAFGKVASRTPVRYGVCRGVVTVSSREQAWDVVVRAYDVSDLMEKAPAQPRPPRPPPAPTPAAGPNVGLFYSPSIHAPGQSGSVVPRRVQRTATSGDLTTLINHLLQDDDLPGTTSPTVTPWGDRLIVVATVPQQRNLERFMAVLRAKLAARDEVPMISAGDR